VEGDYASMFGATHAAPSDPFVGVLLGDLGVELSLHARDVGHPMVACVVHLRDRFDAGHEVRERLELGPLVVGDVDGYVDVNGLLYLAHSDSSNSELRVEACTFDQPFKTECSSNSVQVE
jgi:hypothetical protein